MFASKFSRFALSAGVLSTLALTTGPAFGQGTGDLKVEPAPKFVQDVKPVAESHPAKADELTTLPRTTTSGDQEPAQQKGVDVPGGFTPPDLSDRLLYSEPGDGALWVRGGNSYKARFNSEGATYIPYFGSQTPQNYPVTFRLQQVTVGGEAMSLDSSAAYQRTDNIVSYDRGGLVEVYDLRSDSMEQKFLFDGFEATGDLVVRIAVDSDLTVTETAQGFEFGNEFGHVLYGRATVVDGAAESLSVGSTFVDGSIEIRVPASFVATAALPLVIDPVVSTFGIDVDSSVDAFSTDVAYDQTNNRYTVVWEQFFTATDHDVYSVLLTSTGSLVAGSEVTIDFTTDCWTHPRVANNQISNSFLVVAQTSTSCASPWIIEGVTRNASSNTMGAQFQISGGLSGDKINPDVGGDPVTTGPTYFCVVWERVFTSTDHDVHFQMVRADSTLLNVSTQLLQNDTDDQRNPTVSKGDGQRPFSTQEWNVVWEEVFTSTDHDIYGGQIHWDGSVTTLPFLIDFAGADDRNPEASTLLNEVALGVPRDYMVVYDRGAGNANDIQGRMCNLGVPVSASTNLSALDTPNQATRDQIQPAVDTDGKCFAVVYSEQYTTSLTDYDIYISTFTWNGTCIGVTETFQNMAFSVDGEYSPRITANETATDGTPALPHRFLAAWTDQFDPFGTPGNGDIEGGLYDTVCDACGATTGNYCSSTAFSTGVSTITVSPSVISIGANPVINASANNLPSQPGIFIAGPCAGSLSFYNGTLCVAPGGLQRFAAVNVPAGGVISQNFTIANAAPGGLNVMVNEPYYFQRWNRDPAGGGGAANFSNGFICCFVP